MRHRRLHVFGPGLFRRPPLPPLLPPYPRHRLFLSSGRIKNRMPDNVATSNNENG
jgi:hypothetical protein